MYSIYFIKNTVNGKIYIGYTRQKLSDRWKRHRFEARKDRKYRSSLYMAIEKYGVNSFKIEKIPFTDVETLEEALKLETFWILKLKSHTKEIGYNMKISQTYRDSGMEEDFKKQASKVGQGIKKRKTKSKYVGVNMKSYPYAVIVFRKKTFTKGFKTEDECAEFYDKMALFFFGEEAKINFEEKRPYYLSLDLKNEIKSIFLTRQERTGNLFAGVSERIYTRKDGSSVKVFKARVSKLGQIGIYDTEIEAAEIRDKIILFLNMEKRKNITLNFPERIEEFRSENLQEVFDRVKNRPKKRAVRL
jgi:predicted GIY-YIG superfamily endonuclease